MKLIRALANEIFQCHNFKGVKLVTTSRLDLGHLCEHKFKHVSKMSEVLFVASWTHALMEKLYLIFFLQSSLFNFKRRTLLNNINETDSPTLGKIELLLTSVLLFGNISFKAELN